MEVSFPFQVSEKDMQAFRALSGDENPLHFDEAYAKASGFEGRVVYGGLLVAMISRLLGTRVPGPGCVWHSVSLRFVRPLHVNQTAVLKGTVTYRGLDDKVLRMSIEIDRGADRIVDGTVQAGALGPPEP